MQPLDEAIDKTEKADLEEKMSVQLEMARKIRDQLKVLAAWSTILVASSCCLV